MESVFEQTHFYAFRNSETIQLAHDVVKSCEDENVTTLKIVAETQDLKDVCNSADAAYGTGTDATLTEEVIKYDHLRDDDVTGIKYVAMGWAKNKDAAKSSAGKLIVKSLNKYSTRIIRENLATETTMIRSWYGDVQDSLELQNALNLLGILSWSDDLNQNNETFNTKYVQRSQLIGNNQSLESVTDLLPTMHKKYNHLLHTIDALHLLDKTGAYTAVVAKINGLIQQANDRAAARRKGGSDGTAAAKPTINN